MRTMIAISMGLSVLFACETGNHTDIVPSAEITSPDAGLPECTPGTCPDGEICLDRLCQCAPGFANSATGCVDIDECATGEDDCHPNAACTNIAGGFECACEPGYQGDGRDCADIDECALGTAGCHTAAICTNTAGSASCACAEGYAGDGLTCADVDECALETDRCDANAQCTNTEGGYTCTCAPGFAGNGYRCGDVDECAEDTDDCAPQARCVNTLGGFRCRCEPGYEGNGQTCVDVDECALATDNCSDFAQCTNVDGGFTCACRDGYLGDGVACADVDECLDEMPVCPDHATCRNQGGGFDCECQPGYVDEDGQCVDLDECALAMDLCDPAATCVNTDGDYACECPAGLIAVERFCVDVDECAEGIDTCDGMARCINTYGGFECACGAGYTGNGEQCDDVNECLAKTDDCHENAACQNAPGTFSCECDEGYEGDGRRCDDIDECARDIAFCHPRAICLNTPGAWECRCVLGFEGDGVFECMDVDECTLETDDCAAVAQCINGIGNYVCECPDGFRGDGYTCEDVDECRDGTHDCPADPLCVNTAGGYECAPSVFFVCDCDGADGDCQPGDDLADGRSAETAWRSLAPLFDPDLLGDLEPGSSVRLCRGGTFIGDLAFPEALRCDADTPCALGAYSTGADAPDGPAPRLLGGITVAESRRGLVVDGLSLEGMGMGNGVRIEPGAEHITLRNLAVRGWAVGISAPAVTDFTLQASTIVDNVRAGWLGGGQRVALVDNTFTRNGGDDFVHHNVHFDCAAGCTELSIRGNEITDSSPDEDGICFMPALGVFGVAETVDIADNHIHQPLGRVSQGCDGIAVGPARRGAVEGFSAVTVRGNRVINMGGTAIGLSACVGCLVENNVVVQEQALTFKGIVGPDRRLQPEDRELDAFVIRNNSIWIGRQIDTLAIAIQIYRQGRSHQIVNNAIVNVSQGFNACCIDQDGDLTRYDDISHNVCLLADDNPRAAWALGYSSLARWQDTGFGTNSLEADPAYTAPMGPDFDLRPMGPDSPLVGTAKPTASPSTDLTGRARDEMPDIGAYEYAP